MKRDMDYVRSLLLQIEEANGISTDELLPDATEAADAKLVDHMGMLVEEAHLVSGLKAETMEGVGWINLRLTWAGHDYLETIRDPEIWAKTKEGAAKVGGFSLDVVKALARGFIKKQIADRTGMEVDL